MRPRSMGAVAALVLAACDASGEETQVTVPAATDLAPSQASVSTIAAPELPPPCRSDQLEFERAESGEAGVVLIDIANTGGTWCEADLSASVGAAPDMEPDVWIDPGAVAQLRVELDTTSCTATAPVDTIGLDVNGEPVAVPIDRVDVCAAALTALYPL